MLLSKTVLMKWHPNNKKWYENKGYIFTKWKDEFEVKVEDLSKGSNIKINVECDCMDCKNPYLNPMAYDTYNRHIKSDGKYYCNKCAKILFGDKNAIKTRLKNGISFEQWCINNNKQNILDRWDYELNNCKPNEICYSTKKNYYFKCLKGLHKSELKNIKGFVNGQDGSMDCKACNSFVQWCIDNL